MTDLIEKLVEQMDTFASSGDYDEANNMLKQIEFELERKEKFDGSYEKFEKLLKGENEPITIKETYNLIQSNIIRLNVKRYAFQSFLKLTMDVHKRLLDIKNPYLASNTDKIRKIVAEQMVKNNMTIRASVANAPRSMKPNRAFLDIAMKINPDICKGEVERREKVKLWKAIETGDQKKIDVAKKGFRMVRGDKNENKRENR